MRVQFSDFGGNGHSDFVEVPEGMTASQLVAQRLGDAANNFNVSLNRTRIDLRSDRTLHDGDSLVATPRAGTTSGSTPLQDGDRITVTPKKMIGG